MALKEVKLDNGFECVIDDDLFDDMELVDDLAAAEGENPLKVRDVLNRILGEKQKKELYEIIRDKETGRVRVEEVSNAIGEIMMKLGEDGKNS